MSHKLGRAIWGIVTIGDPANDFVLVDADSTPSGTVYKNGTADALSVTVTKISTGKYKWTCTPTVAASFAAGNNISVTIEATVGGGAYSSEVYCGVLLTDDPAEAGDEMDLVDAPNNTAVTAIQSGLATSTNVSDAESNIRGADSDTLETLSDQIDGTSTLAAQDVADALKLAPTAGAPAAGSVNADLDSLITNVDQKLSTTESNIRGADSDTLETLSDQIDNTSTFDASSDEVNVGEVKGVGVADIDDFKADLTTLHDISVDDILAGVVEGTVTVQDILQLAGWIFKGKLEYDPVTEKMTVYDLTPAEAAALILNFATANQRTSEAP